MSISLLIGICLILSWICAVLTLYLPDAFLSLLWSGSSIGIYFSLIHLREKKKNE